MMPRRRECSVRHCSTPTKFPVVADKARTSGLEYGLLAEKATSDPFGLRIAFGFRMEGVFATAKA